MGAIFLYGSFVEKSQGCALLLFVCFGIIKVMTQIIPAILTKTGAEAQRKAQQVSGLVDWVQLDVVDGVFATATSWNNPEQVREYIKEVQIEVHLMAQEPEKVIDKWINAGVQRIYIHYESTTQHQSILQKIKDARVQAGVALLAHTPISVINGIIKHIDAVLVFSGSLGEYGGQFQQEPTLTKLRELRQQFPRLFVEVDGGVNADNAQRIVQAGASGLVAGSFIFQSADIAASIQKLKNQ